MGAANYISQLLTKVKSYIDNNTLIVGDLNTPFSGIDRSSKQKINKETRALNDTLDQMDLTDIYRTFQSKPAEYTLFSSAYGLFSKTDPMLGYKTSLNSKIKIISCIFSNHNSMRLEIMDTNENENTMIQNLWDSL